MPGDDIDKGDKVSWNWGGGAPGGEVVEKKEEGELAIKSKKGNTIKKNADPENPAIHIGRSGNDVVKRASELNVEDKKSGGGGDAEEKKEEKETNGKKHDRDEEGGEAEDKKEPEEKKQKKSGGRPKKAETNGDAKKKEDANGDKKRGRPKKEGGATSASKKKKDPKPRATEGIGSRTRSRA